MKLLFFVTEDWYFCSHRLTLAIAARDAGFDVTVVTRVTDHGHVIRDAGLRLVNIPIDRGSINPLSQLATLVRFALICRRERPDILHNVALKPVLYGSMAARLLGQRNVVNALTGMGWTFSSSNGVASLLKPIIRGLLHRLLHRGEVIVQNQDDAALLRLLGVETINLIHGSGVDIHRFRPVERRGGPPVIVLVARLIWDKGIQEFVDAARLLRARGVEARLVLVGASDAGNRAGIPEEVLGEWVRKSEVEWWGRRDDMPLILEQAHIACLPSYREGMPKTLLEAAAAGLPIVTTDVPGCREVVVHGENGLLVPPRNAERLADALQTLILDEPLRQIMGSRSRVLAEERFTDEAVIDATFRVYRKFDVDSGAIPETG